MNEVTDFRHGGFSPQIETYYDLNQTQSGMDGTVRIVFREDVYGPAEDKATREITLRVVKSVRKEIVIPLKMAYALAKSLNATLADAERDVYAAMAYTGNVESVTNPGETEKDLIPGQQEEMEGGDWVSVSELLFGDGKKNR